MTGRKKPAARPERRPKNAKPLTARAIAITVLARVEATDAYLNVVLDAALDEHQPKDPRDAALCTELILHCFQSDDYTEGRRAFMDKRKPTFKGR